MHAHQTANAIAANTSVDARAFQRVVVNLQGRLMLADLSEFDCKALDMSPGDVRFQCTAFPKVGERVIAYIDHIGRLEGNVAKLVDHGFVVALQATERKRDKLAAQLAWLANKSDLGLPEDRRHERIAPRSTHSELGLDDGRSYACRIIDLSVSGAAVEIDVRPALGTPVRLGNMRGRVVRHFQEGVAIEFSNVLSREGLETF
ncbi:PilZ domain-containing protein [Rhizobium sp. KVB221]|uniref:PilZ domain-containing protein n=1 Tax=Rhizobium setariae TaxID=2801340 RepID=A0A936YU48_9HYPH|nr:PilZ domain-containing protein [Rhizobium setariae]MBL0375071.1 PilZ domain-containing protein [Rhizobium setariae]